jgi:hypothetical protein
MIAGSHGVFDQPSDDLQSGPTVLHNQLLRYILCNHGCSTWVDGE